MKISNFLNLKSIIVKLKNIDIAGERNFRRDWRIVATSGLIIILGAFSAIWYFSARLIGKSSEVKASSREVLTINRSTMDEIVNFYKNQDKLFQETKSEKISLPDPSN